MRFEGPFPPSTLYGPRTFGPQTNPALEASDLELLARLSAGDFRAMEVLYARHRSRVYAAAIRVVKSPSEAEEVTQEAFLTVFEKADSFRGDSALSTWLHRIAVNHALMRVRKKRPTPSGDLGHVDRRLDGARGTLSSVPPRRPDDALMSRELLEALDDAMDTLPDDAQQLLAMRAYEGLSLEEIAARLDITVAALKSRLHRARTRVRALVLARLGDDSLQSPD